MAPAKSCRGLFVLVGGPLLALLLLWGAFTDTDSLAQALVFAGIAAFMMVGWLSYLPAWVPVRAQQPVGIARLVTTLLACSLIAVGGAWMGVLELGLGGYGDRTKAIALICVSVLMGVLGLFVALRVPATWTRGATPQRFGGPVLHHEASSLVQLETAGGARYTAELAGDLASQLVHDNDGHAVASRVAHLADQVQPPELLVVVAPDAPVPPGHVRAVESNLSGTVAFDLSEDSPTLVAVFDHDDIG